MIITGRINAYILLVGIACLWQPTAQAQQIETGTEILKQLRLQELQERSAASRAKQLHYELQVAEAESAIRQLQQPSTAAKQSAATESETTQVALIGWTERQGQLRYLLRVDERIVRVWDGIANSAGLLVKRDDDRLSVSIGKATYQLELLHEHY
ncbi:hypothetical protein CWE22_04665 [Pseudidiomarina aestuarii]|uniref:Type IV pilus biogenesis protein PilP n=1 Tax=Pseudidiomarina aestuarii TaxID=624146 RepID=A0A7Z6ZUH2_9GAMM|nr:hypothetical protein [Pseudidiomarina aestuarii]RUO41461.1 hypothetical protein CWE22_04665 [Pseudidiomarina aestuarii]